MGSIKKWIMTRVLHEILQIKFNDGKERNFIQVQQVKEKALFRTLPYFVLLL